MTAPTDRAALIEVMAGEWLPSDAIENPDRWPQGWRDAAILANSLLTAIESAGCAVVPMEATENMWCAASFSIHQDLMADEIKAILAEGIAASPYRPGDGG